MNVHVSYTGQLAMITQKTGESTNLPAGSTILEAVKAIATTYPPTFGELLMASDDALRNSVLVMVDGTQQEDPDTCVLAEGADVLLLTPMAGG